MAGQGSTSLEGRVPPDQAKSKSQKRNERRAQAAATAAKAQATREEEEEMGRAALSRQVDEARETAKALQPPAHEPGDSVGWLCAVHAKTAGQGSTSTEGGAPPDQEPGDSANHASARIIDVRINQLVLVADDYLAQPAEFTDLQAFLLECSNRQWIKEQICELRRLIQEPARQRGVRPKKAEQKRGASCGGHGGLLREMGKLPDIAQFPYLSSPFGKDGSVANEEAAVKDNSSGSNVQAPHRCQHHRTSLTTAAPAAWEYKPARSLSCEIVPWQQRAASAVKSLHGLHYLEAAGLCASDS